VHKGRFPDADEAAVVIATPMTNKLPAIGRARLEYELGHEVSSPAHVRFNARLESGTNIEDGDSHLRVSLVSQIGFSDPGDARIGWALDRARLRDDVSNLPDNEPRCVHGRGATVVSRWGATRSRVHRILYPGMHDRGEFESVDFHRGRGLYSPGG
jgi:hypothetical protein